MDRRVPWLVRTLSWCLKPLSTDELALPKPAVLRPQLSRALVGAPRPLSTVLAFDRLLRQPSSLLSSPMMNAPPGQLQPLVLSAGC